MATERVRMWRPADEERILLMAGRTSGYAIEPRGEYVFGIVAGQPMRSRRAPEQWVVQPGQLVAWDPSDAFRRRAPRSALGLCDAKAFRVACEYLGDHPERNVGLEELADAAGIGKFRLIRVFRDRTGLPPHALHLAHRVRAARRLLEAGHTVAKTATATGFATKATCTDTSTAVWG